MLNLLVAFILGGLIGVVITCCCVISSRGDDEDDTVNRHDSA